MNLGQFFKPLMCVAVNLGHEWGSPDNEADYGSKKGWGVLRTAEQECTNCGSLREVFITAHHESWQPVTFATRVNIRANYKFAGRPGDPYAGPGSCI